jgi:hypothetical protein
MEGCSIMPDPRCEDYCIILNADHAVLLVENKIPAVGSSDGHFWQTCEPVNRSVRRTFGIDATTVCCLRSDYTPVLITNVYLMEYQSGNLPPAAQWVALDKLPRLQTPVTAQNIRGWIEWFESDHALRQDWYRPGFIKATGDDLPRRLPNIRIRRIEQVRSWERSSIIRILTDDSSDLYLKSVPPMFAHEPALAAWLSARYPNQFPSVRDHRPGCDFIMSAYSGKSLKEQPDLALWQGALAGYAALQVKLAAHTEELQVLGVPERGLDWIAAHIDALLDDEALLSGGNNPLTADQITQVRALRPRLHAACETLQQFNIPPSLEHGDLWTGQIIVRPEGDKLQNLTPDPSPPGRGEKEISTSDTHTALTANQKFASGGYIYTDWSDSAITYPLFSLPYFLAEVDNELPGVANAREQLRDAYLSAWTSFEPMPRLLEAYELVKLLSPLYTTMQYAYDILPHMERRWEMENMVGYNLRLLLRENI